MQIDLRLFKRTREEMGLTIMEEYQSVEKQRYMAVSHEVHQTCSKSQSSKISILSKQNIAWLAIIWKCRKKCLRINTRDTHPITQSCDQPTNNHMLPVTGMANSETINLLTRDEYLCSSNMGTIPNRWVRVAVPEQPRKEP